MSETVTKDERARAFEAWFLANYPSRVILTRPEWHAPKIYRAATQEVEKRIAELERERDALRDRLNEAETYINALRGPLLVEFGTTDPESLADCLEDRNIVRDAERQERDAELDAARATAGRGAE